MIQKVTFKVEDMHCESCPKLIKMDLEETPGVMAVNATLATKTVTVEYDEVMTNVDKLVEVIKNSGYTAAPLV